MMHSNYLSNYLCFCLLFLVSSVFSQQVEDAHNHRFNTKYEVSTLYGDALWEQGGYFETLNPNMEKHSKRTLVSKNFKVNDTITEVFLGQWHYEAPDGSFKDINLDFQKSNQPNHKYKNLSNIFKTNVGKDLKIGVSISNKTGGITLGKNLSIQTNNQLIDYSNATPSVHKNFVQFEKPNDDIAIQYQITEHSLYHLNIINNNIFQTSTGDIAFSEEIVLPKGVSLHLEDGNPINNNQIVKEDIFLKRGDEIIAAFIQPKVWDDNYRGTPHHVTNDSNDGRLLMLKAKIEYINANTVKYTILLPSSWVNNSSRVFPIYVDPTVTFGSGTFENYYQYPWKTDLRQRISEILVPDNTIQTSGDIYEIGYLQTQSNSHTNYNVSVEMKMVNYSSIINSNWETGLTDCNSQSSLSWTSSVSSSGTWKYITLNSPFSYTYGGSNDNLIIHTRFYSSSYGSTGGFKAFSTGSTNSHLRGWSYSSSTIPYSQRNFGPETPYLRICINTPVSHDITTSNGTVSTNSTQAGSTISVSCDQNYSGTATSNVYPDVGYYLSTNCTLGSSDVLLGSDGSGISLSDLSDYESATLTIPSNTPDGTYYILFEADYLDEVSETNENNNTHCVGSISINTPSIDDITTSNTSVSDNTVDPGQTVTVGCDHNYSGNATSNYATYVGYIWSNDCALDNSDIFLDDDYSSIGSDPSDGESESVTVPNTALAGTAYFLFAGDYYNDVSETSESNNVSCHQVTVNHVADVTISNQTVSTTNLNPGSSFTVNCRQNYQGNYPTTLGVYVGYYLSTDAFFSSGTDILLGDDYSSLYYNDSDDDESEGVTIPNNTASGNYYILFVGDHTNVVSETNESNNVQAIQVAVNQPCSPPLANFTMSDNEIDEGETVDFTDASTGSTITNYSWTFSSGSPSSSSATNPSNITFNTAGWYDVVLTVTNACGSNQITKKVKVLPVGNAPVTVAASRANHYPSAKGGDPVILPTGEYIWGQQDLSVMGIGGEYSWRRYYSSQSNYNSSVGYNWSHNYDIHLTVQPQEWVVHQGDGSESYFVPFDNGSSMPLYPFSTDTMYTDGTNYTLEKKNGVKYLFNSSGQLQTITNRNNNVITFAYTSSLLTTITFPGGRTFTITYNGNNKISSVTDNSGRTVSYTYDGNGDCISATNVNGDNTQYVYDSQHQITSIIDPNGNTVVQNTYDGNGKVTHQLDALNGVTLFQYDTPVANATTLTNPLNHTSIYYHDTKNRLIQLTDELGYNRYFTYDEENNELTQFIDEKDDTLSFQVSREGNIEGFTDALNSSSSSVYNSLNLPTTITDALGQNTAITYNSTGNPLTITYPNSSVFTATYFSNGQINTQTDPNNNTTTFQYNANGDVTGVVTSTGTISFTSDNTGKVQTVTDRNGKLIKFNRDNYGNITQVIYPTNDTTFTTYDANGNVISYKDRNGSITLFSYDVKDRLVQVTDALGNTSTLTYDLLDRVTQITDANGNSVSYSYDAKGRVISYTNTLGTYSFGYDAVGNRTSITDALGNTVNIVYDKMNRPISITDALSNTTTIAYNALGQPTSITDANGTITQYSYNNMGWLVTVTDANANNTNFTYDASGNMLTYTDANGHTVQMTYNAQNLVATKTYPGSYTYSYSYDNEGYPTSYTDPVGTTTNVTYDDLYNITGLSFSNGASYSFTYDNEGLLQSMTNANGTTTLQRNALGWITQMTDPFSNVIKKEYDNVGNTTATIYPTGDTVKVTYNAANLPILIQDWIGNSSQRTYNNNGHLTGITNSNGTSTSFTRDANGRVTQYTNRLADNSILNQHSLIYDNVGQIIQEQQTLPLYPNYADGTENYAYRTDDAITSSSSGTYTNNQNGGRTAATVNSITSSYTWGENDLLTGYSHNGNTTQNSYNPMRQRIKRVRGSEEVRYTLDISGGLSQILQTQDGSGSLRSSYIFAPDGLNWRVDSLGNPQFYHYSYIGHTVALTNGSGIVTDTFAQAAFGDFAVHHGNTYQPFTYLGRFGVEDEGFGQYHIRARDYDANVGRFLTKDVYPGDIATPSTLNRYTYSLNSPFTLIDITGYVAQDNTNYGQDDSSNRWRRSRRTIRGRRWRERNIRRFSNLSIFDERGRELLGRWLNGTGQPLFTLNGVWGEYMNNNSLLKQQIREQLSIDAESRTQSDFVSFRFKPQIQNGYTTGYEMLHGPHDFYLAGTATLLENGINYSLQATWYDIIDPNPTYGGDVFLAGILEGLYNPMDYEVTIIWDFTELIQKE